MVLIARAICQNAGILVMDEPGSSLDYSNHQLLMDTISDLAAQGYSVVLSTHSPEHPFSVAHKITSGVNTEDPPYSPPCLRSNTLYPSCFSMVSIIVRPLL